ncbi:MAG: 1-acyl-sn-glycerol-3-phosphate acyltransferase [Ferruginibacter sp.]
MYSLLKIIARIAFPFYCRNIRINQKEILQLNGPLLIACNHPDSFLDAIILATLFKRPVYALARGDVFANKFYAKILMGLKMFPVYRASEGVENMEHNYSTFEKCRELFSKGGIVLIFSEGRCVNEWKLRSLMKGTARLALSSWEKGIPLTVLPTGINYSGFSSFGKNLQLNFGNLITEKNIVSESGQGKNIIAFNTALKKELATLVIELPKNDKAAIHAAFSIKQSWLKKILLFIPAVAGWILHAPLYAPVKKIVWSRAAHNDHFDSLMVGILFLAYPIYLLLITAIAFLVSKQPMCFFLLLIMPFTAWSYIQLKRQS